MLRLARQSLRGASAYSRGGNKNSAPRSPRQGNPFVNLTELPHDYNKFIGLVRHNQFANDIHVVIQPRKDSPSTDWPLATTHYGYTVVTNKNVALIGIGSAKLYNKESAPVRLYGTPLSNFWYSKEQISQDDFTDLDKYPEYRVIQKSTPTNVSAEEHFIKLFLYRQLTLKFAELSKETSTDNLVLLAGSLGKGLLKTGSDLDIVLLPKNMRRCKNSYTHYQQWWNAIGRDNALEKLVKLDRNGQLQDDLTTEADLLLLNEYQFIDAARVPIITFTFGDIPVDIQCDNFIVLDEVAIQRYLLMGANPILKDINMELVHWARTHNLVGAGGLDSQLKPFHFTSLLLFYCMQRNYIPTVSEIICPRKYEDQGNVVLDRARADAAIKQCYRIESIDSLLSELAEYLEDHDFRSSINLFDGTVLPPGSQGIGLAIYSMKNMVTNSEMTSLFTNRDGKNSHAHAVNIKKHWGELRYQIELKQKRAEEREQQSQQLNDSKYKVHDKEGTDFDFQF